MGSSSTRRLFSDEETQDHINVLELKAILLALAHHIRLAYIKILCDNSTAVVCINKFGTSHWKMWHLMQTNLEMGTVKWKLALGHTHFRNTKHRGRPQVLKEWGPYWVENQGKYI